MKFMIALLLCCAGPALADTPCIDAQTAMSQTRQIESTAEALPALPAGWIWIKTYQVDENNPELWQWQSWLDEVTLSVCDPPHPKKCSTEINPVFVSCGGTCQFTNGYTATQTCIATYSDGNSCQIEQSCMVGN